MSPEPCHVPSQICFGLDVFSLLLERGFLMLRSAFVLMALLVIWMLFQYGGTLQKFYQQHKDDPRLQRASKHLGHAGIEGGEWLLEYGQEKLDEAKAKMKHEPEFMPD